MPTRAGPAPQHSPRARPAPAPKRERPAASIARPMRATLQEGDASSPCRPCAASSPSTWSTRSARARTWARWPRSTWAPWRAARAAQAIAFEQANGFKLTFLPFIVHAVVRALREFPGAERLGHRGCHRREEGHQRRTRRGDREGAGGAGGSQRRTGSRSRAGGGDRRPRRPARATKLTADDLQGGTFTVSNPGRKGNLYGFAIINQPQVGIVRMGEMVKRPVVRSRGR